MYIRMQHCQARSKHLERGPAMKRKVRERSEQKKILTTLFLCALMAMPYNSGRPYLTHAV